MTKISINKAKVTLFVLGLASLIITSSLIQADTTLIISKIVNMNVPSNIAVSQAHEESTFLMEVDYIIENPTNDSILISCCSTPIYRLKIDALLEEEEMNITIQEGVNPIDFEINIEPGIIMVNTSFTFLIKPYIKAYLPVGNYTFWIDFPDCCTGNFSLVTLKSFMNVTEEDIFITHETDTNIYTYKRITVIETNFYLMPVIMSISIIIICLKIQKNKIKNKHV